MQKPTLSTLFPLPAETRRLQVFLGDWKTQGTLRFMGKTFKVTGTAKFASAAAGWAVTSDVELEIEGVGLYREADILGFDRNSGLFHFFATTNTGAVYDHTGKWSSDKTITFIYEAQQNGKTYKETLMVTIVDINRIEIHEEDTLGSQETAAMQVTLTKQQ